MGAKKELGRYHRFVKPTFWTQEEESMKERFSADCFNNSSTAIPFTDVLADFLDWLPGILDVEMDELNPEDFLFVGWRGQEVQFLLPRQCNTPEPGSVAEELQNIFFCR